MGTENNKYIQIDNMFRIMRSQVKGKDIEHYDYTNASFERRKSATKRYYSKAESVLSDVHKKDRIVEQFTLANSLMMCGGYNHIDRIHTLTLAAAIWILDQLSLQNSLDQIYKYVADAEDGDDEDEFFIPYVYHPAYDYDLIHAVVLMILHRNDGIIKADGENGSLVSEAVSEKKSDPPEVCRNRKTFNAVMELIDKDAIEEAVTRYEQKIWEFYRLVFKATQLVYDKLEHLYTKAYNTRELIGNNANIKNPLLIKPAKPMLPDLGKSDPVYSRNSNMYSPFEQFRIQDEAARKFEEKTGSIYSQLSLVNDREKTARNLADVLPPELVNKLCTFSVEDPFETAFAILYLLDKDSDIPWLYYGSISVAYTADDQLPFNAMPVELDETVKLNSLRGGLYRHKYPGCRWPEMIDSDGQPVKREFGKNLSQLLYANSWSVFPRVTTCLPQLESFLAELGTESESEKNAYAMMIYCMDAGSCRNESLALYRKKEENKEVIAGEPSIPTEETEISREDFIRQKQEIHTLKKLLHDEASRRRITERQNKALADEKEFIRRELADLRELVFSQENNLEQDKAVDETIKYPFRTHKRIMAFGGQQAWLKAIRPLLPDVRFVQPDTQPNADLIRNADVIWIQTNCFTHSAFYKIIDIVRGYNKQIRYFRWSSAEKCAEQLVRSEKA